MKLFCYLTCFSSDKYLAGLGNEHDHNAKGQEQETRDQVYYQWISIIFCVQALCFYLPYYLWQNWEGGQMNFIVKDLGKSFHNYHVIP